MRKSGSAPTISTTGDGGLPILNHSQIAEWNRCRYRYDLSTRRHINSRAVIRNLELGSACHVGMDAGLRTLVKTSGSKKFNEKGYRTSVIDKAILDWSVEQVTLRGGANQLTEEEMAGMDGILANGPEIAKRALDFLGAAKKWRTLELGNPKKPAIELGVQIKFPGWRGFHGTIDWAAEDLKEGGNWIIDYKFREQFTPPEMEEVNLQMAVYQWLVYRKFGLETTGTIMFQGRSRIPTQPSLNKNGTMSRARISTNWETYEAALRSAGLDPNDYVEEMKPKLDYEFFRLDRVYRPMEEVEAIWNTIVKPNGRIILRDSQEEDRIYRNFGFLNCQGCWAREFCLSELRNEDTDFLLKTRYIDLDNPQERLVLAPEDLIIEDD